MSVFRVILVRTSPYWLWMREKTDQNNSKYGHFLGSAIFEISLSNKCKQTEELVITNVKSNLIMMLHSCYFSHLDPQWINLKFNFTRLFPNSRILFSNIHWNCYRFEVFSSLILQICSLPPSIVSSSPIKNYRLK